MELTKMNIDAEFRNIIYLDYLNFNSSNYVPIEIERTKLGDYLGVLLEATRNENAVPAFSYPFLRILIKMGDVLCNVEDFTYSVDYSVKIDNLIKELFNPGRS